MLRNFQADLIWFLFVHGGVGVPKNWDTTLLDHDPTKHSNVAQKYVLPKKKEALCMCR